eukprot:366227-Chlamydomonas_euryale.AAC.9
MNKQKTQTQTGRKKERCHNSTCPPGMQPPHWHGARCVGGGGGIAGGDVGAAIGVAVAAFKHPEGVECGHIVKKRVV